MRAVVHIRFQVAAMATAVVIGLLAAMAPMLFEAERTMLAWRVATVALAALLAGQAASAVLARVLPEKDAPGTPPPIDFDKAWRGEKR